MSSTIHKIDLNFCGRLWHETLPEPAVFTSSLLNIIAAKLSFGISQTFHVWFVLWFMAGIFAWFSVQESVCSSWFQLHPTPSQAKLYLVVGFLFNWSHWITRSRQKNSLEEKTCRQRFAIYQLSLDFNYTPQFHKFPSMFNSSINNRCSMFLPYFFYFAIQRKISSFFTYTCWGVGFHHQPV